MSDEKALLAAIWEHPHDDTPRLVYADWLQENGQPERAEFIRVQVELARLDEWDEERRPALKKQEEKLLKRCEKLWRRGQPAAFKKAPFRRGFVCPPDKHMTAERFCALPPEAFAAAPSWSFTLEGWKSDLGVLARSPNLLRVEALRFWLEPTPEGAGQVLGSPNLRNVRTLTLGLSSIWVRGLPALKANANARDLTELEITDGLNNPIADVVGSSPAFSNLRALKSSHHTLTAKGVKAIFGSKHLTGLTELMLPTWYGEPGLKEIAASRPKFQLRKLNLYGAWTPDESVAAIAEWPCLATVQDLTISGHCQVLGPRALATSPHARNLRRLDLGLSRLDRAGALALARSKTLDLRLLEIRMTPAAGSETVVAALVKRFGKDAVKVRYPGQRKQR